MAERLSVVCGDVDFEDQCATVRLPDVALTFKALAALFVLSQHHALAIDIERATAKGVDGFVDVEHCDLTSGPICAAVHLSMLGASRSITSNENPIQAPFARKPPLCSPPKAVHPREPKPAALGAGRAGRRQPVKTSVQRYSCDR